MPAAAGPGSGWCATRGRMRCSRWRWRGRRGGEASRRRRADRPSAGSEEPNALVTVGEGAEAVPNGRATVIEAEEGLVAASQNRWPSLGFDLMAANDLVAPLLGAGFYYKTFMWPARFWEKLYEPA